MPYCRIFGVPPWLLSKWRISDNESFKESQRKNYVFYRQSKYLTTILKRLLCNALPYTQILSGAFFHANKIYDNIINANAWKKKAFCWSLIKTNWRNKIQRNYEFCCFFLHKLWPFVNHIKNFKQTGIYSRKYTSKLISTHLSSHLNSV